MKLSKNETCDLQRRVEKLESEVELLKMIVRLQNTDKSNTKPFFIDKSYEITCEDKQPSFCVKKSDSWKLKELAGSEKKVTITIPVGFKIGNPWDCLIPAEVKE